MTHKLTVLQMFVEMVGAKNEVTDLGNSKALASCWTKCISYLLIDIDKYWSDLWASDFELNQDLHLPEENKYIGKAPEREWILLVMYLRG